MDKATHNNVNTVKSKKVILLQTARVIATNEDGTVSQEVRILFDSISQRSYITNSLKNKPLKIDLNAFGEKRFKTQKLQCDTGASA